MVMETVNSDNSHEFPGHLTLIELPDTGLGAPPPLWIWENVLLLLT